MEQELELQSQSLDTTELIEAVIMTQDGTQDAVLQLRLQAPVYLLREPDNPAHDNSIRVEDEYGNFLGYLMWELADFVAQYMDEKKCPLYGEVIELTTESSQHSVRLKICFNLSSSWCATHPYPDHRYFQNIDYYFWHDPIRGNVKIFINCSERIFNRIRAKFFESGFEVSEKYSGLSLRQPLWKPPYQWALHFRKDSSITETDIKTFFEKEFQIISAQDRIKTIEKDVQKYDQDLFILRKSLQKAEELVSLSDQIDKEREQEIIRLKKDISEHENHIKQLDDEKRQLKYELTLSLYYSPTIDSRTEDIILNKVSPLICTIKKKSATDLLLIIKDLFPDRIKILDDALKSSKIFKTPKYNQKIIILLWTLATQLWENFNNKTDWNPYSVFFDDYARDEGQWSTNPVCIKVIIANKIVIKNNGHFFQHRANRSPDRHLRENPCHSKRRNRCFPITP